MMKNTRILQRGICVSFEYPDTGLFLFSCVCAWGGGLKEIQDFHKIKSQKYWEI